MVSLKDSSHLWHAHRLALLLNLPILRYHKHFLTTLTRVHKNDLSFPPQNTQTWVAAHPHLPPGQSCCFSGAGTAMWRAPQATHWELYLDKCRCSGPLVFAGDLGTVLFNPVILNSSCVLALYNMAGCPCYLSLPGWATARREAGFSSRLCSARFSLSLLSSEGFHC